MITRPLDLASRMRPEPSNFDWVFYVNGVALVFFFVLYGSPFVLAPGLSVDALPMAAGATANAKPTTHFISVLATGQIYTPHGPLKQDQLETWLAGQARTVKTPVLLIRGDDKVPMSIIALISGAASRGGFVEVILASVEAPDTARTGGR
jgi:biopolymer transport protein ExbD